jgi:hypothetical protein
MADDQRHALQALGIKAVGEVEIGGDDELGALVQATRWNKSCPPAWAKGR